MNLKDNKTVLYSFIQFKKLLFHDQIFSFCPQSSGLISIYINFSLVEVGLDNLNSSKAVKLDQKESRIKIM